MKNVLLRALSLLLFMQSCIVWPMQSNSTVSPEALAEIQTTLNQVRNQIADQNNVNPAELVANIRAEMSQDAINHDRNFSDLLEGLEENLHNFDQSSNNNRVHAATEAYQRFLNIMTTFQSGSVASLEKEREKIKNLNTVFLGHSKFPIALYKRDLITLPFMAFDVFLAYKVFQTYKQYCVDHIYKTLTKNPEQCITWLTELANAQQIAKSNVSRKERADASNKIEEITQNITQACQYTSSSSFKNMMIPLVTAIVGHKASSYMRKKIMTVNSFLPEAFNAYTKNSNGEYERFLLDPMYYGDTNNNIINDINNNRVYSGNDINNIFNDLNNNSVMPVAARSLVSIISHLFFFNKAPMSVSRALSFPISNPNINLAADYIPDQPIHKLATTFDKVLYKLIGLPDWFYTVSTSRITRLLIEVAVIWQVLLLIDALHSGSWIKAATETNRDELITLLRNYKETKKTASAEQGKKTGDHLKQFVAKHTVMPSWRNAGKKLYKFIFLGRNKVNFTIFAWTFTTFASYLLWKNSALIKASYSAIKNDLIPPQISIALGIYASIYIGLPLGISVITVCKDIWGITKKAINFLKRKKLSKKNELTKPILTGGS